MAQWCRRSSSVSGIRSATVKIAAAGATLLVDPYLAPKNGGKTYAGTLSSPLVALPQAPALR